jgi:hypothetical protein
MSDCFFRTTKSIGKGWIEDTYAPLYYIPKGWQVNQNKGYLTHGQPVTICIRSDPTGLPDSASVIVLIW